MQRFVGWLGIAASKFHDWRARYGLANELWDNGPPFIAKHFKEFIMICGIIHVMTSPCYPQSNGNIERWDKTLKGECIRVKHAASRLAGRCSATGRGVRRP